MPQVVAKIDGESHKALKQRAKENFRTIGNQLVAEAFMKNGLPVPAYLNSGKSAKPAKKKGVVKL